MGEINIEVVSLNPTAIIELFQLEVPPELGGDIYCFHAGVNMFKAPVKWQGTDYQPFPIEAEGFSLSGRGEIARPKLKIANLTSYIRGLVVDFDGLIGSKVTRIRTFTRFLDSANFTTTNPDAANKELSRDEFYIDRKISENKNILEFELASPWDLENVKLPRRQIFSNLCAWKYRSAECGVTGNQGQQSKMILLHFLARLLIEDSGMRQVLILRGIIVILSRKILNTFLFVMVDQFHPD